ncbi:MAG: F0F1 ATP synthase subunit A [Bdellovibrionota bacterium]
MSAEEFNFVAAAVGTHKESVVALVSMGLVAILLVVSGLSAAAAVKRAKNPLVPESRLTVRNLFELLAEFLIWMGDIAMGKENRKYLPFAATLFVFILAMNLLGLVPGFVMPTHMAEINAGLALTVFVLYNFWGIRELGIFKYLKHMFGPFSGWMFPLGVFLFCIELISHTIRPLSLTVRLYGNMTGDHLVLGVFTEMTQGLFERGIPLPIPVIFYFMGTLVSLIQAFVFTILTMIYISLATAHEEEDHH